MPSNLTWPEARTLALAGERIRRALWETEWIRRGLALWFLEEDLVSSRVVRSADFTATDRRARDWTTEPYTAPNPCDRQPPEHPPFTPPGISLSAVLVGSAPVLALRGTLGGVSDGGFLLVFFVNDVLAVQDAGTGAFAASHDLAVDSGDLAADLIVTMQARSILPLPAWTGDARVTIGFVGWAGTWTHGTVGGLTFEITGETSGTILPSTLTPAGWTAEGIFGVLDSNGYHGVFTTDAQGRTIRIDWDNGSWWYRDF